MKLANAVTKSTAEGDEEESARFKKPQHIFFQRLQRVLHVNKTILVSEEALNHRVQV